MMEKDDIKDLFAKSLSEHQIPVDPSLWAAVSSSIATSAAKTGLSLFTKSIIGLGAATIAITASYFIYLNSSKAVGPAKKTTLRQIEKPIQSAQPEFENQLNKGAENGSIKVDLNANQGNQIDHQSNDLATPQFFEINETHRPNTVDHLTPALSNNNAPVSNAVSAANLHQNQNAQAVTTAVIHYPHISAQPEAATLAPKRATTKPTLPNIFTPNGDGQNDELYINWKDHDVSDFSLVVLNQNNQVVYRNSSSDFRWDGTDLGGEKLPRGFYIYFVTAQIDNEQWQQSSSLQIQY
jgi:gliding motility-associated-like protein